MNRKVWIDIGDYPEAQYTIIVDVVNCGFGAFAEPVPVPAKLQCAIQIVKTGTTETLASTILKGRQIPFSAVGTPVDFDRMFFAFGKVGEAIGKSLAKVLK